MLILPIKKKWFDMILSGEKKEEYREIKPYWHYRLIRRQPKEVLLRNGYSKNSPTIKCRVDIEIGIGKPEWGAVPDKKYYILKILDVKEVV